MCGRALKQTSGFLIYQIQKMLKSLICHYSFRFLFVPLFCISNIIAAKFSTSSASEITSALSLVQPGDTILMKKGTWLDQKIVFQKNGTAEKYIYLLAEVEGEVFLTGTSSLRIAGDFLVVSGLIFKNGYSPAGGVIDFKNGSLESNYCRLTNTSIIDYNPSNGMTDYKWISLYGTHNRVDHCYLKGKTNIGTSLVVWLSTKPNYHQIDSNYFGYRPVFPGNGAETIRIGTSDWSLYDSFTTVEYNYFEQCNGEIEIISNKSFGNNFRFNTFKDCEGTLTLRHGNRATVEGNFFFCGKKANSGGIRIIGEDHRVINNYIENSDGTSMKSGITMMNGVPNSPLNRYFQVKRAIVAFNTVVNSRLSLNIGAGKDSELSLPPLDCIVANNIFYSTQAPLVTFTDQPINMTWSGNMFYGSSLGMTLPENNFNADPQLLKSSDNLYRLSSISPAINNANQDYNYVTVDMDGQQRRENSDIGADEFSTEPIKMSPVSAADTGPGFMREPTSVSGSKKNAVTSFMLYQNYPNPFNPSTTISFTVPVNRFITLKVYNILGIEVASLIDEEKEAGWYNYELAVRNYELPSGIYFYQLRTDDFSQTRKMVVLK